MSAMCDETKLTERLAEQRAELERMRDDLERVRRDLDSIRQAMRRGLGQVLAGVDADRKT